MAREGVLRDILAVGMQPDPEYLRRHYGSLSDEALLEIRRPDLIEAAQKCYDAELEKRGLASAGTARRSKRAETPERPVDRDVAEEPDTEGAPEWLDEAAEVYSAIVTPGSPLTPDMANAREALEEAGIPCYLQLHERTEEKSSYPPVTHQWRLLVPGELNLEAASTLERDLFNADFEAEWRAHLENLSDEELVAMTPEKVFCGLFDRVERVSRVYDEEIARRGGRDIEQP